MWVFSETLPPIKNKDNKYDPAMRGPVKAVPAGKKKINIIRY